MLTNISGHVPLLKPYIHNIQVLQSNLLPDTPRHLPCFADGLPGIMFWEADQDMFLNKEKQKRTSLFLYGQTVKPIELTVFGSYRIIIIYLYPHVIQSLFGIEAQELTDSCMDLEWLPVKGVKTLKAQLSEAFTAEEQKNILLDFLCALIKANSIMAERDIAYVTHQLMRTKGNVPLKLFQEELTFSQRTFERKFLRHVGISPRLYARICRFNAALNQIREGNWLRLTDVAYDNGYADQAHLSRTFKEFTGFTPTGYLSKYSMLNEKLHA